MSKIEEVLVGSDRRCVSLFAAAAAAVLVSRAVGQQRRIPDEHVKRDKVNASSSDKPKRREDSKERGYREEGVGRPSCRQFLLALK